MHLLLLDERLYPPFSGFFAALVGPLSSILYLLALLGQSLVLLEASLDEPILHLALEVRVVVVVSLIDRRSRLEHRHFLVLAFLHLHQLLLLVRVAHADQPVFDVLNGHVSSSLPIRLRD